MKTAIVFYSRHHGNTKKLLDAIAEKYPVTLIDATKNPSPDLSGYDAIGFASGIYYSKYHKSVLKIAENIPAGKKVFFLHIYGAKKEGYFKSIEAAVSGKQAEILGGYECFGFNTFGPFKLIGGIAKGHPDSDEIRGAVKFYEQLSK